VHWAPGFSLRPLISETTGSGQKPSGDPAAARIGGVATAQTSLFEKIESAAGRGETRVTSPLVGEVGSHREDAGVPGEGVLPLSDKDRKKPLPQPSKERSSARLDPQGEGRELTAVVETFDVYFRGLLVEAVIGGAAFEALAVVFAEKKELLPRLRFGCSQRARALPNSGRGEKKKGGGGGGGRKKTAAKGRSIMAGVRCRIRMRVGLVLLDALDWMGRSGRRIGVVFARCRTARSTCARRSCRSPRRLCGSWGRAILVAEGTERGEPNEKTKTAQPGFPPNLQIHFGRAGFPRKPRTANSMRA